MKGIVVFSLSIILLAFALDSNAFGQVEQRQVVTLHCRPSLGPIAGEPDGLVIVAHSSSSEGAPIVDVGTPCAQALANLPLEVGAAASGFRLLDAQPGTGGTSGAFYTLGRTVFSPPSAP